MLASNKHHCFKHVLSEIVASTNTVLLQGNGSGVLMTGEKFTENTKLCLNGMVENFNFILTCYKCERNEKARSKASDMKMYGIIICSIRPDCIIMYNDHCFKSKGQYMMLSYLSIKAIFSPVLDNPSPFVTLFANAFNSTS